MRQSRHHNPLLPALVLLITDVFSISLAFYLGYQARRYLIHFIGGTVDPNLILPQFYLLLPLVLILFLISGLYPGFGISGLTETGSVIKNISIAFVILGLSIYIFKSGRDFSRIIYGMVWLFSIATVSINRMIVNSSFSHFTWWKRPALIVGMFEDIRKIIPNLLNTHKLRINPVAISLLNNNSIRSYKNIRVIPLKELNQAQMADLNIDLVVLAESPSFVSTNKLISDFSLHFRDLVYLLHEDALNSLSIKSFDFTSQPALRVEYHLLNPFAKAVKAASDLVLGSLFALVMLPLFLILALLIKIDSPGPALYKQTRMGKNGHLFGLYKFRTMAADSDNALKELLKNNVELREEYAKYHKLRNDPRITRIGRFLRKSSLDELPQLLNILKGEMSLVGPRAYMPREKKDIGEALEMILRVKPGLTGWWQVMGRHEVSFANRVQLDKYYIINFSLWMDLYIMIKTVWIILRGKGA